MAMMAMGIHMASHFAGVFVKGRRSRGHAATGLCQLPAAGHAPGLAFYLLQTPAKAIHDFASFLGCVADPVRDFSRCTPASEAETCLRIDRAYEDAGGFNTAQACSTGSFPSLSNGYRHGSAAMEASCATGMFFIAFACRMVFVSAREMNRGIAVS